MSWMAEVWKTGTGGKAIRVAVMYDVKPDRDQNAYQKNQTTGLYRRLYQEWPEGEGERVKEIG
jgi:hypothetical protein